MKKTFSRIHNGDKSGKREFALLIATLWIMYSIIIFFGIENAAEAEAKGNTLIGLAPWMLGPAFTTFCFHGWLKHKEKLAKMGGNDEEEEAGE